MVIIVAWDVSKDRTKNEDRYPNLKKQNHKRRILLVDDNSDTALSFKIGIQDDGFEVDAFYDPALTLSAFKPDSYDLLALDIMMDKINGFELYERIKQIDDKVKVCIVTFSND